MLDHINILGHVIERIMINDAYDLEDCVRTKIILMGSFQFTKLVNDIDLIIVYEISDYIALKKIKKIISNALYNTFGLPVHYTTLSKNEYIAMKHLHMEKHQIIFDYKKGLFGT